MENIFSIDDPGAVDAPDYIKQIATEKKKKILKIVWDQEGGYPEHSWGYVQWSTRPFTQTQGCDGTIDLNVHLIAIRFCNKLGLNYPEIYTQAYAWQKDRSGEWLKSYPNWEKVEKETLIPEITSKTLRNLLYDLNDINNRSVVAELSHHFTRLGFDIEKWWDRNSKEKV